jgi:hypothetical protein
LYNNNMKYLKTAGIFPAMLAYCFLFDMMKIFLYFLLLHGLNNTKM